MDRRVPRRLPIGRYLIWGGAGLVSAAAAAVAYVHFALVRSLSVSEDRVVLSTARMAQFSEYIPATATVMPRTTAYLDVVEAGQVAERLVEEGAFVERDQPLVRLKNTTLELDVLSRQAQLMEQLDRLSSTVLTFQQARLGHDRDLMDAQTQVKQLLQKLRRFQALRESGGVAVADIESTTIDLDHYQRLQETMLQAQQRDIEYETKDLVQLREAVKTTQTNLAMSGQTLQGLTVRAPISGQLTALDADLGAAKASGQRIGQIDDVKTFKVEAEIDEFYLGRVVPGQAATGEIEGTQLALKVSKVYSQVNDRQFKVDLLFAGAAPDSLRRGQTLQARISVGTAHKSLVVGNGPFFEETGGTWAFVLPPAGHEAIRRPVHFGRRGNEQIEVISGLSAGERVITSGYGSFRNFDRIELRAQSH
jgi:HlyD family secretion protein